MKFRFFGRVVTLTLSNDEPPTCSACGSVLVKNIMGVLVCVMCG